MKEFEQIDGVGHPDTLLFQVSMRFTRRGGGGVMGGFSS
jgi:hypothetical protein